MTTPSVSPPTLSPEEPKATPDEPKATLVEPKATLVEPKATLQEPKATHNELITTLDEPKAPLEEPKATPNEPKATPNEPKATSEEPNVTPDEPKATPEEPNTTLDELRATLEEPKATPDEPKSTLEELKATTVTGELTSTSGSSTPTNLASTPATSNPSLAVNLATDDKPKFKSPMLQQLMDKRSKMKTSASNEKLLNLEKSAENSPVNLSPSNTKSNLVSEDEPTKELDTNEDQPVSKALDEDLTTSETEEKTEEVGQPKEYHVPGEAEDVLVGDDNVPVDVVPSGNAPTIPDNVENVVASAEMSEVSVDSDSDGQDKSRMDTHEDSYVEETEGDKTEDESIPLEEDKEESEKHVRKLINTDTLNLIVLILLSKLYLV